MDSLDVERLIGSLVSGALGGRRKRSRGALRFLTGGRQSFLNGSTLLALAGVAWGVWETASRQGQAAGGATPSGPGAPASGAPGAGSGRAEPPPGPPPLPAQSGPVVPPPLPGSVPTPVTAQQVPPEVLRVLRLTLSAARADGTLTPHERESILAQARAVGAEPLVVAELEHPQPLAAIAGGVANPRIREDLYTLAFSIVRADEDVTPEERRYLTDLAAQLQLDAEQAARLEAQAAARIQAAAKGAEH